MASPPTSPRPPTEGRSNGLCSDGKLRFRLSQNPLRSRSALMTRPAIKRHCRKDGRFDVSPPTQTGGQETFRAHQQKIVCPRSGNATRPAADRSTDRASTCGCDRIHHHEQFCRLRDQARRPLVSVDRWRNPGLTIGFRHVDGQVMAMSPTFQQDG